MTSTGVGWPRSEGLMAERPGEQQRGPGWSAGRSRARRRGCPGGPGSRWDHAGQVRAACHEIARD